MKRFSAAMAVMTLSVILSGCFGDDWSQSPPAQDAGQFVGSGNTLNVSNSPQQTQVWCWAATSEMVLRYYRLPYSQTDIVTYIYGFPAFSTATTQQMQQVMLGLGGIGTRVTGPLTLSQLAREIDNGKPIIAAYSGSFVGHVVVIYGYDAFGNIQIHDPFFGSFSVPYANTFTYNGQMIWSQSILLI